MVFFITVLRALAACVITNAHYSGVYPIDLIANGGLLGDVVFFAVSGYCLYNIKTSFSKWYGKRLVRCYLPVWIITSVYLVLGLYSFSENGVIWYYIYPTYYHFVSSIVILYIPYYFIIKQKILREHLGVVMLGIAAAYIAIYLIVYDKGYYHIDNVREPMIRFLFIESMLLGAWFREHNENHLNTFTRVDIVFVLVSFFAYFASKVAFSRITHISQYQIINQILLFALLYFLFKLFAGLNGKLERLPRILKKMIAYVAKITLEIYLVQYVIIDLVRPLFGFPMNWLALSISIFLAAVVLHFVTEKLILFLTYLGRKIKRKTV